MTEHLPIQRFTVFDPMLRDQPFDSGLWADAKGQYVTYADHVAALRACEERVREDEQSNNFSPDIHWDGMAEAYQRGLDAAREAVLGAKAVDIAYGRGLDEPAQFIWLNQAISAIDALRNDNETPPPLPPSVGVPERRWF